MQIVIEIPEKDIPKRGQGMIIVHIDFHTGELCRCTYPCKVIPKGHGDLIDRDDLREDLKTSKKIISFAERMNISCIVDHASPIIKADEEENKMKK